MKTIISLCLACIFLSGCAVSEKAFRFFIGGSTIDAERYRSSALVKVFNYDYDTCYAKMKDIIKNMPKASIYVRNKQMIALYYIDPNNTSVGVFFKAVDPSHTQVEVSSAGPAAKEWVAKNLFSEKVLPRAAENKYGKSSKESPKRLMIDG